MNTNGYGHPPVPSGDAANLREPLPWMSRSHTGGAYRLPGLRYPLGSLIYGLVLIALGAIFLAATLGSGGVAAGVFALVIFGGLGIWMIVIAAIRWPWYRKYLRQHGHPPF